MKTFLLERVDGGVEIMRTAGDPLKAIAKWAPSRRAEITGTSREIAESDIPTDRTFRNAWKAGAGCIECDMPKARLIACDKLRHERAMRFKVLDGEWMRETARGNALVASEIEAKRETMRNWPQDPRIAQCATLEELKSLLATMKAEDA